ncbi:MAG: Acetyltransferase [Flavobacteriales bacterium]|nr:Acetyltransferase [Flavobacteriales bacterium]
MNKINFKVESVENQSEVIRFLDDMIYEYNSKRIGKYDGQLFTRIIRNNNNNNIIAGITGWTWAGISEITILWVNEDYRGKGLGKKLLSVAEDEIINRGCSTIFLRSYSFQAPIFYLKNGYEIIYILDEFPNGFKHYNLIKKIT